MQGILYCSISAFKTLFNQAALRAVLKSSIFIDCCRSYLHFAIRCVYASSTLPFIGVSNRFSWSLFGSIPIDYKTLELYYFVFQVYLLLFWHPWVALKGPLFVSCIGSSDPIKAQKNETTTYYCHPINADTTTYDW